jgi:hypothetical protein
MRRTLPEILFRPGNTPEYEGLEFHKRTLQEPLLIYSDTTLTKKGDILKSALDNTEALIVMI